MPYVYLLSDHDEGGSDNVVATLNRDELLSLVDVQMGTPDPLSGGWVDGYADDIRSALANLLQRTDADLAVEQKHCLTQGWGGMQLHVVKLHGT